MNFKFKKTFCNLLGITLSFLSTIKAFENEKNPPFVSVIVPVYNGEKYLNECIESIRNQSLKNIEIICVNDGSKDHSLEILKNHANEDSRIKVIDKENSGVSRTRQMGLDNAHGEYVAFVDADDKIDSVAYEVSYNIVKKENSDIICFGWENFTDTNKDIIRNNHSPKEKIFNISVDKNAWKKAKRQRESIYIWNKLYKRSLIQENKISFNYNLKIAEDEYFNLSIYPFAKKIINISNQFYKYRQNENSTMFKTSPLLIIKNYIKTLSKILKFYEENKINFSFIDKVKYFSIYKSEIIPLIKTIF